jgi:hypothetical protein
MATSKGFFRTSEVYRRKIRKSKQKTVESGRKKSPPGGYLSGPKSLASLPQRNLSGPASLRLTDFFRFSRVFTSGIPLFSLIAP